MERHREIDWNSFEPTVCHEQLRRGTIWKQGVHDNVRHCGFMNCIASFLLMLLESTELYPFCPKKSMQLPARSVKQFENKFWCKLAGSRWIHANLIHFFRRRRGLHEGDLNPLQWSYLTLISLSTQISFALWIEGIFEVCKRRKLDNSSTNRKHLEFVDFENTVPKDCFYFWHV